LVNPDGRAKLREKIVKQVAQTHSRGLVPKLTKIVL
jgi:hypothetical protein